MANAIGIDFGTTKTMVSYFNPATGLVELVRLGRDRDSIPTTVHIDESGAFLFGEDADDQIEMDPEGYCRAFKLHLGERDSVSPRSDETAESLAAHFLRHVKDECEKLVFHGEAVTSATISPARKASLKRAAEAAGFTAISFLPEPEAAGTAFMRDNPADKFSRALVLDWGGGTLDIAVISRDSNGAIRADSHCAEGRDDIGGEEMDMIKAENKQLKAKQGVKEFAEDAAWKEIKAKMARTYRVKRHGKVYNFILLTWAMLCCAIREEYKRLSAWNREG